MTAPRVSICFSTFNHVDFLRTTLPSIQAQTEAAWELFVWDDGSTDDTCAYVESLADPRIRLLKGERSHGLPHVLNRAYFRMVQEAAAPMVCTTVDGTVWHPEKLARQLAAFAANPALLLACSRVWVIDEAGNPTGTTMGGHFALSHKPFHALCMGNSVAGPTMMMRRDDYLRDDGQDTSFLYSADYHHWLRLAARGPFHYDTMSLVGYRFHSKSSSRQPWVQRTWTVFGPAAIQDCLAAYPPDPDDATEFRARSICLDKGNDASRHFPILLELALGQLRRAAMAEPHNPQHRIDMATALARLNRFKDAEHVWPDIRESLPTFETMANTWQATLHEHLAAARRVWRGEPGPPWQPVGVWQSIAATELGWAAWRTGDVATASELWMEAYVQQSYDPATILNLGHVFQVVNSAAVARRAWELAAALRPTDPGLRALLDQPVAVRIFAVAPSDRATALVAAGYDVTVGGAYRPGTADLVLLHDDLSLALLECDPAPVFIWSDDRSAYGIPGLVTGEPLDTQIRRHLTGPRRRFLPWGDPPVPRPMMPPTAKTRHWLLWLPSSATETQWEPVLRAYLQTVRAEDDCCLVIACDSDSAAATAVAARVKQAIDRHGGPVATLRLMIGDGVRFEGMALISAMSAVITVAPDPSLSVLAATLAVPIVAADPAVSHSLLRLLAEGG